MTRRTLDRTVAFLRKIGLDITMAEGATGFVEGILIVGGNILVDPNVCQASDLLHEAGHLAIMPPRYRSWVHRDVDEAVALMWGEISGLGLDADHPLTRAAMQAGDCEASAWAYAAGLAVGLAPKEIIQDHEYNGEGEEVRNCLIYSAKCPGAPRQYIGIHGLAHAGFCSLRAGGPLSLWPRLAMWLQTADFKKAVWVRGYGRAPELGWLP